MKITVLTPNIGTEISDIDLSVDLDDDQESQIYNAAYRKYKHPFR